MEKLAHYLEIRAFQYPSEDPEKVKKTLNAVIDLESEQEELKEESLESHKGAEIKKYEYKTENRSEVREIINRIFNKLNSSDDPVKHLNEDGEFYIRLDKQELYKGNFKLTDSGDVVHVKVKIASYPFRMKTIRENLKKLISTEDQDD